MPQEVAEKRSGFRFPAVVPVEYFKPDNTSIASYALNLSKSGTFISTDDSLGVGSEFPLMLNIPFDGSSSQIVQTQGTVVWDRIQPFKSKQNGMGVKFNESLPEDVLLHALADTTKKFIRESEAKKALENRVEDLESELEDLQRLATLGRYVEKILHDVSNPLLAISGNLEIMKKAMHQRKQKLAAGDTIDEEECRKNIREFDDYCKKVDKILKDYAILTKLAQIAGETGETLERKLAQRYGSEHIEL
jgi:Tfp pilus assembly protein PilZ